MNRPLALIITLSALMGCDKDVAVGDVLQDFTVAAHTLEADGQSTTELTVTLPKETSAERRNIIFMTSGGAFSASGTAKYTVKAEFVSGKLMAKASLRAPLQPSTVTVSAQLEYDSPVHDYIVTDTVHVAPSVPATLKLEPSLFGLGSNFTTEVRLVGTLHNALGHYVSKNNKVLFEDLLLNGSPANGRFRYQQNLSNDTSRVSVFYAANAYPIGTAIKLKATVLNANGMKASPADSVLLTINQ